MPGVFVLGETVSHLVVNAVIQLIGADLLQETYMIETCTEERAAAWPSVEPKSHRVFIVGSVDGLDEEVVKGPVWVFDVEIPRINAGVVLGREALYDASCTGMVVILSPAGAEKTRARRRENNIYLIMVIYLLSSLK